MKEWLSAQESADAHSMSKAGFIKMAARNQYKTRHRAGRGGGLEYCLSSFPAEVQAALLKAESREILAETPLERVIKPALPAVLEADPALKNAGDALAAHLSGKPLARMDARINILRAFQQFILENPMPNARKVGGKLYKEAFAAAWNRGAIDSPARAVIPYLTSEKLDRWPAQLRHAGLARLAGNYGHRRGQTLIDQQPQLAVALRSLIIDTPHASAVFAHELLCARYQDSGLQLPSVKTVARWMNAWKAENHSLYCRISDPDRWKSTYMLAWGDASEHVLRLNQEWQADSTPADLGLSDGRHNLIFLLDVYSRRLKIQVSKTSTAAAIASVLRRGLLEWGVPEVLKTDNGKDYVADHINRICHTLHIERQLCAPFSPWQKGHVERHVRTFSHDLLPYLPGYLGHNVAERQALRAREQFADRLFVKNAVIDLNLSAAVLQEFCDRWCEGYHNRPHRGLDGQTPNQVFAAWREPIRILSDERALDILLAPAPSNDGWRQVSKDGGVKVDGYEYLATALALHVNDRVRVMYDPEGDMGKVYVFDGHGHYLATAECAEITGRNRREIAHAAKAIQTAAAQQKARAAKSESKKALNGRSLVEFVDDYRAAHAREIPPSPLAGEGRDGGRIEHTTPYIKGAAQALLGHDALSGGEITPEMLRAAGYFEGLGDPEPDADVVALPEKRRTYDSHIDRIRDVYARFFDYGKEPNTDDLFILHEYYDDREHRGAIYRLDESLRALYRHADIDALKQRWLALPLPPTPSTQTA